MADKMPDIHGIFNEAVEREAGEERGRYLDEACQGDHQLKGRIEALLCAHADAGTFLGGSSPPAAPTLDVAPIAERPGTMIGRYKLLQEIGEGGFGIVYMAEQREPVRRKVALKIIKPGMDTRAVVARFESERQALALMDHPNIAHVFDAGATESGRPYFVMELVHGVALTKYCDEAQLTTGERLELFVQVCQAVQHAHQKGIIHRDLKPSNVMVTLYDGVPVPKVIDFGVAKATGGQLTEKTAFTGYGQMIGTPLYMSPEQTALSALDVDTRSDIYSLGVLLYELLTGTTPFTKEQMREAGLDEIRRMIREDEPMQPSARISTLGAAATTVSTYRKTDPAKLGKLLRRDLDWIVMKALQKDRTRRYQTANDFARDIQRYLADEPIEARPPTIFDRAARWARRHRPLVWSAAVLLVLCSIGSLVSALLIALERGKAIHAYEEKNAQLQATERAEKLAKRQEQVAKQQERLAREQRQLAEAQKEEAVRLRDLSEQYLYVARMRLAQRDWEQGQVSRLLETLNAHVPQRGRPDLRGWEWYYHLSLCYSDLMTIRGHRDQVTSVVWSADGGRLATASSDGSVKIWDAATGKEVRTLSGHAQPISSVDWSPDRLSLATASVDGTVKIWDAATGREVRTLFGHTGTVGWVAWSPDSRRLATGGVDRSMKIWDAATGQAMLSWIAHASEVHKVAWSPDGKQLASRSRDLNGLAKIWDATTGKEVRSLRGSGAFVSCFAWSPDGRRFALQGHGHGIQIYDPGTGHELQAFDPPDALVCGMAWSPDSRQLALAGYDALIQIWDPATGQQVRALRGHANTVNTLAWSPDGARLASGGLDRTVKVWDASKDQGARTIRGHTADTTSVAWSRADQRLATGSKDRTVRIWDVTTGQEVLALLGHSDTIGGVVWSPEGKRLASFGWGGSVKIWDTIAGKESLTLSAHRGGVTSAAWNPDGRSLASAGRDRNVKIWDPATGGEILSLPGQHGEYDRLAWSPNGTLLAATGENGTLTVWEAATGKTTLTVQGVGHWHNASPLAWSLDGRWLASESSEGRVIQVWNAADGRASLLLRGHTGLLSSLAWHPDGHRLASGDAGGTIKIWDVATGQEVSSFRTQGHAIAAWSHDGQRLAATSGDHVQIWDASVGYRMASGPEYRYDQARHLAAQGRYDEALVVLRRVVEDFPGAPEARWELAACLARVGQEDERIAFLQKLADDFPSVGEYQKEAARAYFRRGDRPFHQGDLETAFPDMDRAVRLDPEYSRAYDHRGDVYRDRGELEKAIADYTKAIQCGAVYGVHSYGKRALTYLAKGEFDKALKDTNEAIRLYPSAAQAYAGRAALYLETDDFSRALNDLSKAVEVAPDDARIRYQWALVRLAAEQLSKYRSACVQTVAHFNQTDNAENAYWTAWTCALGPDALGDFSQAVALAQTAVKKEPTSISYACTLGAILYRAGRMEEAIQRLTEADRLAQDAPQRSPSSPAYAWFFLAMAHHRLGHAEAARKWQSQAVAWTDKADAERRAHKGPRAAWNRPLTLKLLRHESEALLQVKPAQLRQLSVPQRALACVRRGRSHADKGDFPDAIAAYSEAIQLEPQTAEHFLARGEAYAAQGELKQAAADFAEAIRLDPKDAAGWVQRGSLHADQGELDQAHADFQEALRADPFCGLESFLRGEMFREQKQFEHAIPAYRAAARLDPQFTGPYLTHAGLVQPSQAKLDQMLGDFRQLLRLRNDITPAWLQWASSWLPAVTCGTDKLPGIVFASDIPWIRSTCGWGPASAVRNGYPWGGTLRMAGLPYAKAVWTHAFADTTPADVVLDISGQKFATFKVDAGVEGSGSVQFQVLVDGKVRYETPVMRVATVQTICVDVAAAKEVVLRVLNGGDGNISDSAGWGFPRFVQADSEGPGEIPSATDANAALLLAEVHRRLDHKDLARRWYDKAVEWMDKNQTEAEKLRGYREEAARLLGIAKKPATAQEQPEKP